MSRDTACLSKDRHFLAIAPDSVLLQSFQNTRRAGCPKGFPASPNSKHSSPTVEQICQWSRLQPRGLDAGGLSLPLSPPSSASWQAALSLMAKQRQYGHDKMPQMSFCFLVTHFVCFR